MGDTEDKYLQSLLEKHVFILVMHGTTIYNERKKTFDKFTIPEDQTIVSFTSPGEYMNLNMPLTTYFTHNSNSRIQTLLPLISVNDASDLYGKVDEIYWYVNDIHMVPSKGLGWNVKEKPSDVMKGFKTRPFHGGISQFESFYRAGPGSTYPDMQFSIEHTDEEKYMGLFEFTSKGVERINVPESLPLSILSKHLPPNSILFTISCSVWTTESLFGKLSNTRPNRLETGVRNAIRAAETLVRENELTYKSTHPLLSSKSAKGWDMFRSLFGRVRIPIFYFQIDPSRPGFKAPTYALSDLPASKNNLEQQMDPVSAQNFRNADAGLTTGGARSTKRQRRNKRRTYKRVKRVQLPPNSANHSASFHLHVPNE